MKARIPVSLSPKDYKRVTDNLNELAHRYAAASSDAAILALILLLNRRYHFGEKRLQPLLNDLPVYLADIRRQQVADGLGNMDDIDCMEDAVRRLSYLLKKTCNIKWSEKNV